VYAQKIPKIKKIVTESCTKDGKTWKRMNTLTCNGMLRYNIKNKNVLERTKIGVVCSDGTGSQD
jgi:hypothetical protein